MNKWGVWCIRYSSSVMGPAEQWMVTGGRWDEKTKTWDKSQERRWEDTEQSARILAARLHEDRRSDNVAYEAKEVTMSKLDNPKPGPKFRPQVTIDRLPRRNDGSLCKYSFSGRYPLYYVCANGSVLCPDCAQDADRDPEINVCDLANPQWCIVTCKTNLENKDLVCSHCSKQVEVKPRPTTPKCPNCGKSGQLRVHIPAVFAIDPSGRPPGYNPIPVSNDGPDRKDPAFCAADGCEWLGQYQDLVMR